MELGSAKGETRVEEPTRAERAVGRRSAESRATVPDLELTAEVELSPALEGSLEAALVGACAVALSEVPRANASYRDGRFELHTRVNVGVAIAAEGAYVMPTVFDAERKSLAELTAELAQLEQGARAGTLVSPDLSGATFTLYPALGPGVKSSTALVVPSQAAAVSAGAIRDAPVVKDGTVVPGRVITLTLACDHRILFGTDAATFLGRIKSLLEEGAL